MIHTATEPAPAHTLQAGPSSTSAAGTAASGASVQADQREALETSVVLRYNRDLSANAYQRAVFSDQWPSVQRIARSLILTAEAIAPDLPLDETPPTLTQADRILGCCRDPQIFLADDDATVNVYRQRCKSRLCPLCSGARARDVYAQVREAAKLMDDTRFITLTLVSTDADLAEEIKRLTHSFRRLRQRKLGRQKIKGGIYTVEVTYNPGRNQWHPHLHAIVDGDFIKQSKLAAEWKSITTDSTIVDIRRVHGASDLAHYITRYVAKTNSIAEIPDHKLSEWATAVHGLRFVQAFGTLHGKMPAKPEPPERRPSKLLGYLGPLAELAASGDDAVRELLHDIHAPDLRILPDPAVESLEARIARVRDLARRVRAAQRSQEDPEGDRHDNPAVPATGRSPPANRAERLWEDDGYGRYD